MATTNSLGSRGAEQARQTQIKSIKKILLAIILILLPSKSLALEQDKLKKIAELVAAYQSPKVQFSLLIEDAKTGQILYEKNPDLPLNPASTLKLLASYGALLQLGPNYRFKTQILSTPLDPAGAVEILTLKGFGDPTFSSKKVWELARALKAQGLKRVDRLLLDDTYFTPIHYPGRQQDHRVDAPYNAPVSALSINQNLLTVLVRPGARRGAPAQVELVPPLESITIQNTTKTQGKRTRLFLRNLREYPEDDTIQVRGTIPPNSPPQSFQLAQVDPTRLTGKLWLKALHSFGIQTPKKAERGSTPPGSALWWEELSPPLHQILEEVNKNSNNFVMEQIVKVIATESLGAPGTTVQGIEVITNQLKKLQVPLEGSVFENGSGLSKNNRITTRAISNVLKLAYQNPLLQKDFFSSLSVLGVDGTLENKFFDPGLEGYFLGKTGTLSGVTSLSGYVFPKGRPVQEPILFALIANGKGKYFWKQLQLQQKLLELLINS